MRILFISPNVLWGGASIANITISKLLANNGNEVIYNDEYFPSDNFSGFPIDHTKYHTDRKRLKLDFVNHVVNEKFDIIIWDSSMTIYYYRQIKQLSKLQIKNISVIHSLSLRQNLIGKIVDQLTSYTLSMLDAIIYVSNFTLESWNKFCFIKHSKATKVVIYNSIIETDRKNRERLTSKYRLGYVGRFSEEKQPELFCKLSECCDFELHAFGDGPLLESVKKKYKKVFFYGLEKEIEVIYNHIDILVLTSRFENCPLVILEAMSRGVPIVAPRVGGIPELLEDGIDGALYDIFEPPFILRAVERVIKDYDVISANCLKSVRKFYSSEICREWNKLLNEVSEVHEGQKP